MANEGEMNQLGFSYSIDPTPPPITTTNTTISELLLLPDHYPFHLLPPTSPYNHHHLYPTQLPPQSPSYTHNNNNNTNNNTRPTPLWPNLAPTQSTTFPSLDYPPLPPPPPSNSSSSSSSFVNHSLIPSPPSLPPRLPNYLPSSIPNNIALLPTPPSPFGPRPSCAAALTLSNIETALSSLPSRASIPPLGEYSTLIAELQHGLQYPNINYPCPNSLPQLPNSANPSSNTTPIGVDATTTYNAIATNATNPTSISGWKEACTVRPLVAPGVTDRGSKLARNQNASKCHKKVSDLLLMHRVMEGSGINVKRKDPILRRENHIILERQRRKSMTHLFSTLQSIVPTNRPKTNNRCEILADAYNHIVKLHHKLNDLKSLKSDLQMFIHENSNSQSNMKQLALSKGKHKDSLEDGSCLEGRNKIICSDSTSVGVEFTMFYHGNEAFITIGNDNNTIASNYKKDLSAILMVLEKYNLDVINATLSTSHGNNFYSIHAKARNADVLRRLDRKCLLEELGINKLNS